MDPIHNVPMVVLYVKVIITYVGVNVLIVVVVVAVVAVVAFVVVVFTSGEANEHLLSHVVI